MGGYIGNEPTTGHFPVDNFTSSGGSTYTLSKAPGSAGAIEVSVQGVLQPTTAYTVSGTTLTMAGVTSGVKIFVRHLGETLVLPTPADGTVTATKLAVNSVDGKKIAMGSDARGAILYHGATDYARLAKGTSGHVLTMGANDPAWAAPAAGGAWNIVGTNEFSSTTSVTITGLSSLYDTYAIVGSDIQTVTDHSNFGLRLGDSSGVDSGGTDYAWHIGWCASDSTSYNGLASAGADYIWYNNSVGNATGEGCGFLMYLHRPGDADIFPMISGTHAGVRNTGVTNAGFNSGTRLSVITVDRVNLYERSSANMSGRLTVYGIAHA